MSGILYKKGDGIKTMAISVLPVNKDGYQVIFEDMYKLPIGQMSKYLTEIFFNSEIINLIPIIESIAEGLMLSSNTNTEEVISKALVPSSFYKEKGDLLWLSIVDLNTLYTYIYF